MRVVLQHVAVILLFAGFVQNMFARNSEKESFDRKLYSVAFLSQFGTSPKQFASLNASQKTSLLACHDVLIAVFQHLDKNSDISQYLTHELARKYVNGTSLVDPESSLMEVGVFDWSFHDDGKRIELWFLTVAFSEGNWVLSKNAAILAPSGSGWRIAEFRWNEK